MEEDLVNHALLQKTASVRFGWGPTGAANLAEDAACLVIVDVLSFTTTVAVAVGRGMAVLPYRLADDGAQAFAAAHDARLAVPRGEVSPEHPWSLSPAALTRAPITPRLVLPSPNGSAIAAASDGVVVAACLRNTVATARWILQSDYGTVERPVLVVAAGERWPDGSLRPALEDALGAGAVLHHLRAAGCDLSPEASAEAATYRAIDDVGAAVRTSASALELVGIGFAPDVEAAVALDCDDHAAVLRGGAFVSG